MERLTSNGMLFMPINGMNITRKKRNNTPVISDSNQEESSSSDLECQIEDASGRLIR
jgi:hypothetical protein